MILALLRRAEASAYEGEDLNLRRMSWRSRSDILRGIYMSRVESGWDAIGRAVVGVDVIWRWMR